MILQTGGSALGDISTRSNSSSSAILSAFDVGYTPTSTLSPTNRTSLARIFWLILCWSSLMILAGPLDLFLRIAMALSI